MDGTRVFVVALLLCLAPIAGVVASDTGNELPQTDEEPDQSMTVVTVENSSEYLAPQSGAIDRAESRAPKIDVAGAIEADAGQLRSIYLRETLERRYRNADTDAERRAVVERGTERLSDRVDGIEAKERTAIRQFNEGTIGSDELFRALATVHREAEATDTALEWLETTADDLDVDEAEKQAAAAQVRLVPMEGPIRKRLSDAIEGGSTSRIHVETVGDGIVLAMVSSPGETYLREAHDPTAKQVDVSDQYDGNPSPALDRFTELYPWAIQSFDAIDAIGPAQVRLYRFSAAHPHGELKTYLDSGSTDILYEKQRIDPESVPTTTIERTDGDLRLRFNTTRAGGPLGISAVDTTTEERVDAAIELNGEAVGTTDESRLWTVAPRGQTTVNATYAGETRTFDVRFD
ncbi:MAG: hypothetical protein V5A36_03430 [Natronomonas sp.]